MTSHEVEAVAVAVLKEAKHGLLDAEGGAQTTGCSLTFSTDDGRTIKIVLPGTEFGPDFGPSLLGRFQVGGRYRLTINPFRLSFDALADGPDPDFQETPELAALRKRLAEFAAAMESAAESVGERAKEALDSIERALGNRLAEAVAASKTASEGVNSVSVKDEPIIQPNGFFRIDLADVLAGRVAFAHAVEGTRGQQAVCRQLDIVMPDGTIMHVGRAHGSGLKVTFEAGPKREAKPGEIVGREYRWPLAFDAEPGAHPWPFSVTGVQTEFQCDPGAQSTQGPPAMTRLSLSRRREGCNESATLVMRGRELARSMRVGDKFHVELRPAGDGAAVHPNAKHAIPAKDIDACIRWPALYRQSPEAST